MPSDVVAAVGPEGGFTDEEVDLARAAEWTLVGLGPRILRVETAALMLAVCVSEPLTSPKKSAAPSCHYPVGLK